MKIESISIKNFKLFETLEVSFKDQTLDEISDRFLILGDNGRGKSTLLQAIALPLALATYQINSVQEFDWVGFLPERYLLSGYPKIEMYVTFERDEIQATQEVAKLWYEAQPGTFKADRHFQKPSSHSRVKLSLEGGYWQVEGPGPIKDPSAKFQFLGRFYARKILHQKPSVQHYFDHLPGVFWFDQSRNLENTKRNWAANESSSESNFVQAPRRLRDFLIDWEHRKLTQKPSNYLMKLEALYQRLFPHRRFAGVESQPSQDQFNEDEFYFMLANEKGTYALEEMSGGEQAIFPILYQLVRQNVARSIVLIDEVDLHLHPPLAQAFVAGINALVPDCQFIFSTHSEAVNGVIGEDETYRLPGGSLCL